MLPLKIAILWHQHQPYYKKENEFIVPWVRLHGIKDYFDLAEILHEFPNIKQTFNLVPSLMKQIDEYISGDTIDNVQRLTALNAEFLTHEDKKEILKYFFMCNVDRMVLPWERYRDLYERSKDEEYALNNYSEGDWRDLQVWYNLTWLGPYSRQQALMQRMFKKGRDFTEEEKYIVMDYQRNILTKIKPQMKSLLNFGQIEVSTSPMYHPILPLLCNSASALEAMPGAIMPDPLFVHPEDASAQIELGMEYYRQIFGSKPMGMWPSEGSISDEALSLIASSGIKWVASDEEILMNTKGDEYKSTDKFFPHRFKSDNGDLAILFRDHFLSDNIGFVYSKWDSLDAARDFCNHLKNIRNEIIKEHGEESLKHAVVPVILDGENCWEFYFDNGLPFLRSLYNEISNTPEFKTVTCSEATAPEHLGYKDELSHIRAGSWINSNFSIWIGHEDDRKAWRMLANARQAINDRKNDIPHEEYLRAMDYIYVAEGSDWFWWYGDEHMADNKDDFDILFRWYIVKVYETIGLPVPQEANIPITEFKLRPQLVQQKGEVKPLIDGKISDSEKWVNAGSYDAKGTMSTMHQIGELLNRLYFAADDDNVYFRADTVRQLQNNESISLHFVKPQKFELLLSNTGIKIISANDTALRGVVFAIDETIEFSLSKKMIYGETLNETLPPIEMSIVTVSKEAALNFPRSGTFKIQF